MHLTLVAYASTLSGVALIVVFIIMNTIIFFIKMIFILIFESYIIIIAVYDASQESQIIYFLTPQMRMLSLCLCRPHEPSCSGSRRSSSHIRADKAFMAGLRAS